MPDRINNRPSQSYNAAPSGRDDDEDIWALGRRVIYPDFAPPRRTPARPGTAHRPTGSAALSPDDRAAIRACGLDPDNADHRRVYFESLNRPDPMAAPSARPAQASSSAPVPQRPQTQHRRGVNRFVPTVDPQEYYARYYPPAEQRSDTQRSTTEATASAEHNDIDHCAQAVEEPETGPQYVTMVDILGRTERRPATQPLRTQRNGSGDVSIMPRVLAYIQENWTPRVPGERIYPDDYFMPVNPTPPPHQPAQSSTASDEIATPAVQPATSNNFAYSAGNTQREEHLLMMLENMNEQNQFYNDNFNLDAPPND